ncbi:hypothetical protein BK123_17130 [Paenibacillus lautus]|uniref:Uncharacterized protein n=1 Tax=Paenibacillus lautus TaxID=1401 RepID=A0A1R1B1A4_PAELA|nr:hypothetical protein BK123_17130 [Paenibacillus lautus]
MIHNIKNSNNFCRFTPSLSVAVKPVAYIRLHEIIIPTLIIISDQDHPFNKQAAETLHIRIERSSKVTMQDCGHLPFVEAPQEFNQVVLDFLSQRIESF